MGVTRRTFLVGATAACAGCAAADDEVVVGSAERSAGTDGAPAATDTSLDLDAGIEGMPSFGGTVDLGPVDEVAAAVEAEQYLYVPEARAWVVRFAPEELPAAEATYGPLEAAGMPDGFVALYQKCPHLGCRVPECRSAGRFECPCHGSAFSRVGEHVSGPAPRGMDRFRVERLDGRLVVDTSAPIDGAPRGTATIDGEPTGPACIGPDSGT